jgi:hypothetical protein
MTKFIDKLFRITRPTSATWDKWGEWRANFKKTRPITYFIVETIPLAWEWLYKQTVDRANASMYYCSNRFVTRTHRLDAPSLKKGQMHELSKRMLHCNFDAYVKWCETEASVDRVWTDEAKLKYKLPWYASTLLSNFVVLRNAQCAIDHLKWEMALFEPDEGQSDPASPHQAMMAYEKMTLYVWWTKLRPARVDSWVESGLVEFWDEMDKKYSDSWIMSKNKLTAEENATYNRLSAAQSAADEAQLNEDNEMLVRLVKIRDALWT